jgi:DnaJ-class molecular chaperone
MRYTKAMIGLTLPPVPKPQLEYEPTAQGRFEPCSQCHGDNGQHQIRGTGIMPCIDCSGTGYFSYSKHSEKECFTCKGLGEIHCFSCNGTGEKETVS